MSYLILRPLATSTLSAIISFEFCIECASTVPPSLVQAHPIQPPRDHQHDDVSHSRFPLPHVTQSYNFRMAVHVLCFALASE